MIYGYARVSTAGQGREGNSLEAQEQTSLRMAPPLSLVRFIQVPERIGLGSQRYSRSYTTATAQVSASMISTPFC
jgi:hypothetical protein